MTLDEAIIHAEHVAESNEDMANAYHTDEGVYLREESKCRKCAEEHRQLVEWLTELKERRAKDEPNSSEKPNNCDNCIWSVWNYNKAFEDEPQNHSGEATEMVKDKPQTDEEYINSLPWTEVGNGEQTDDAYFLKLMGAVERGEISDAGANQAWYEYINHKDEPQVERSE